MIKYFISYTQTLKFWRNFKFRQNKPHICCQSVAECLQKLINADKYWPKCVNMWAINFSLFFFARHAWNAIEKTTKIRDSSEIIEMRDSQFVHKSWVCRGAKYANLVDLEKCYNIRVLTYTSRLRHSRGRALQPYVIIFFILQILKYKYTTSGSFFHGLEYLHFQNMQACASQMWTWKEESQGHRWSPSESKRTRT